MAVSKSPRRCCSCLNIFIICLQSLVFLLTSASFIPIILINNHLTSLGWALLFSSTISLSSAFIGFFSQLTQLCFMTHVSVLLAALVSQGLSFYALFSREKSSLSMLKSTRDPREAMLLVRLECGILMVMIVMELGLLVLSCVVHSCWVRDYEGLKAEKKAMETRRSWNGRRNKVQQAPIEEEGMEMKEQA